MKKFKLLSLLLAVCLIVPMLSGFTFPADTGESKTESAPLYGNISENAAAAESEEQAPEYPEAMTDKAAKHTVRLEYKEELNTLVYANPDGTETLYLFGTNIKYIDETGKAVDKTTDLTETKGGYANGKNDIRVVFPTDIGEGVTLTYKDTVIRLIPESASKNSVKAEKSELLSSDGESRERVVYGSAFEKASIVYTPTFDGFKEDIVVAEYNGITSYGFILKTNGLILRKNTLYSGDKEIGSLGEIIVTDSAGNISFGKTEAKATAKGEYSLKVTVDGDFMKTAVYPVYIDPSVTVNTSGTGSTKSIQDAPVYSVSTSAAGGNSNNYCGYVSSGTGFGKVLMKFPGLLSDSVYTQLSANQITSVVLHLREGSGKSGSATVYASPFLEAWTESTVRRTNVNINNYYTSPSNSVSVTKTGSPNWWEFNITNAVKEWKNGSYASGAYGIILVNSNESSAAYLRNFLSTEYSNSSYRPYIELSYTPVLNLNISSLDIYAGNTNQLSVQQSQPGESYTWHSSNSSVVTVSTNGLITAVSRGTATVTVTSQSGDVAGCSVHVFQPYSINNTALNPQKICMNNTSIIHCIEVCDIIPGTELVLEADDDDIVEIADDDDPIYLFDDAAFIVNPLSVGNTCITASITGYQYDVEIYLKVYLATIHFENIADDTDDVTTFVGIDTDIVPYIDDDGVILKNTDSTTYIGLSSSNTSVATINSSGVLTPLTSGSTIITARYLDSLGYPIEDVYIQLTVYVCTDLTISFVGNTTIVLNNDEVPNNSFNINARVSYRDINGVVRQMGIDENIVYTCVEIEDEGGSTLRNFVTIGRNNGVITTNPSHLYSDLAHPTGKVKVIASYKACPTVKAELNVSIECNDYSADLTDMMVPHYQGRYILINHEFDDTGIYFSNYDLYSNGFDDLFTNSALREEIIQNFSLEGMYATCVNSNSGSAGLHQKAVSLIRNSDVCVLFTHGCQTGISMNNESDLCLTVQDILNMHKGYFSTTKLVFLKACSTSDQDQPDQEDDSDDDGVMAFAQALGYMGAGAVIAFTSDISALNATTYEARLYECLGTMRICDAYAIAKIMSGVSNVGICGNHQNNTIY